MEQYYNKVILYKKYDFILFYRKKVYRIARDKIEDKKDKTTIVTNKTLLDRVGVHVKKNGDNQTDFLTRAIINQLEREGDIEIRTMIEEENNMQQEVVKNGYSKETKNKKAYNKG